MEKMKRNGCWPLAVASKTSFRHNDVGETRNLMLLSEK